MHTYIGQIRRLLALHLQEHHQALRSGHVTSAASAVAEHTFDAGQQLQVDLFNTSVIVYHSYTQTHVQLVTALKIDYWHIPHHSRTISTE